jgi:putative peptidoglycan lipid II flippase
MLLSMPAATALIALAHPIVRVLFQHGAFSAVATDETAMTLVWFSAGLPAFVLFRVLQPGFFAREDTLTPTWFAGISAVINIAASLILFPFLQHVGIAIATSLAAWANAVLLAIWLGRRGHFFLPAKEWGRHGLIVAAAVAMAVVLYGLAWLMAPFFSAHAQIAVQLIALGLLCGTGLVLYFVLVHVSGAQPMGLLLRRLRRGA